MSLGRSVVGAFQNNLRKEAFALGHCQVWSITLGSRGARNLRQLVSWHPQARKHRELDASAQLRNASEREEQQEVEGKTEGQW